VVWNQTLWTAGYSLTSGGFLTYFGKEPGATGLMIGVLLVVPEIHDGLFNADVIVLGCHLRG
jgi:hypothetical protein